MAAESTLGDLFSKGPFSARMRFKFRPLTNCAFVAGIFIPATFVCAIMPFGWAVEIALIGVLFFLFFYIWQDRPIWIRCPGCGKLIATNTPWRCGFCGEKNQNSESFPFVHRCEHCGAEPKAYRCHHQSCGKSCSELIFFTEDELQTNFATCAELPQKDTTKEEMSNQERERRGKEHELAMADLDARLEAFRARKEFSKKLPVREAIKADYEKGHANFLGTEEFADARAVEIEEECKNNPGRLERERAYLQAWRKRRLAQ